MAKFNHQAKDVSGAVFVVLEADAIAIICSLLMLLVGTFFRRNKLALALFVPAAVIGLLISAFFIYALASESSLPPGEALFYGFDVFNIMIYSVGFAPMPILVASYYLWRRESKQPARL